MRLVHRRGGGLVEGRWERTVDVDETAARALLRGGEWTFDGLPPGKYMLTLASGHSTVTVDADAATRFPGWHVVGREYRVDPAWAEFIAAAERR